MYMIMYNVVLLELSGSRVRLTLGASKSSLAPPPFDLEYILILHNFVVCYHE